jgi:hypothetical protein
MPDGESCVPATTEFIARSRVRHSRRSWLLRRLSWRGYGRVEGPHDMIANVTRVVLKLLVLWCGASVPIGVMVGRFIRGR